VLVKVLFMMIFLSHAELNSASHNRTNVLDSESSPE